MQLVTASADLTVARKVLDAEAIKDLVLFVNGDKTFYQVVDKKSTDGKEVEARFETRIKLKDGLNVVTLQAREDSTLSGSDNLMVYFKPEAPQIPLTLVEASVEDKHSGKKLKAN